MTQRGFGAFVLAAALAGCGGNAAPEPDPEPEPEVRAEAETEAAPEEAAPAGPSAEEFPMAEDFAEAVATEITAENFEDELARLEAELDAEAE